MAKRQPRQGIPTNLSVAQFEQFVLPHLSKCRRGPATKLGWHTIFNYILRLLYLGCQWNVSMAGTIAGRTAKPFSTATWFPTSIRIHAVESGPSEDASPGLIRPSSKNGSVPSNGCSPGKTSSAAYCFALNASVQLHYAFKTIAYTMINLRHYCRG